MNAAGWEKRTANLASLQIELGKPALLTALGFSEWVQQDEDPQSREALLRDTLWGSITWSRSIGRPATSRLAQGFVLCHENYDSAGDTVDTGGPVTPEGREWGLDSPPDVWDGPAEGDSYRVDYLTRGRVGRTHRIRVTMAQVGWTAVPFLDLGAGYYDLGPEADQQHDMTGRDPFVFEPLTVMWARALGPGNHIAKRRS